MADASDVEAVLVSLITAVLYPGGTASPSLVNAPGRVYRGWPVPKQLDADLAIGKVNVTVYPLPSEQKTTRYPQEWQALAAPATPTLTLTVSGTTITVGGTPSSPLNAAALVNGTGTVYAVQPGDTLNSVAAGLAALINAFTPATSSGPVITIPAAKQVTARVGGVGTVIRELKRQRCNFQITFWCPTPALRDAVVPPVDAALAAIDFLSLPDGSAGRLLYVGSPPTDRVEREGLYRRDLIYSVEYATTQTANAAQVVVEIFNLYGGLNANPPLITSFDL